MKKLLATAAVCGLAFAAAPANAEVKLEIGGFFKGYGVFIDQDEEPGLDANEFDFVRETELHFSGETTLDNGLTVGAHIEADIDGVDGADIEENYVYFSGGWGRVNAGEEDGAQYLLQVATPSADSNIDGIRQYVQPVNYTVSGGTGLAAGVSASGIDYETNATGYSDKITYLSPVFSGFQVGLSYSPDTDDSDDLEGVGREDQEDTFGDGYEIALRYEGQIDNIGVTVGAGYTGIELEQNDDAAVTGGATDDRNIWNVGVDLDIGPFGFGVSYSEDDYGDVANAFDGTEVTETREDEETWVVGLDYTTGPFKLGASYLHQDGTLNVAGNTGDDGVETERFTGGVVYTYGPGMTFRGSLSHIEHENVAGLSSGDDTDATSVLIGTQINF